MMTAKNVHFSWQMACQLPTDRQLEVNKTNGLRQIPDGGRQLNPPTRQLGNSSLFSGGSSLFSDGAADTSPYGRESLPSEGSPPRVGIAQRGPSCDVILALDLGTHTGWALRQKDGSITSGTQHFTPSRFEGGGMRFLRFKHWLTETKNVTGGIDAVFFEEVRRHVGVDAAHAYGGFLAHLTAWCEHHGIPYRGVPVGTIKKHATGKGNADKQAMIDFVKTKGFNPADDNEADALALLDWAIKNGGAS